MTGQVTLGRHALVEDLLEAGFGAGIVAEGGVELPEPAEGEPPGDGVADFIAKRDRPTKPVAGCGEIPLEHGHVPENRVRPRQEEHVAQSLGHLGQLQGDGAIAVSPPVPPGRSSSS